MRVTTRGRRARDAFIDTPVDHVRDLRTAFLVKCELRRRIGLGPADLAGRQLERLDDHLDALISSDTPEDIVASWRARSAAATREFLREMSSR
ncbi:MAG: hypothetical protein ACPGSH_05515 [Ilumatobacteraceae bacterium]